MKKILFVAIVATMTLMTTAFVSTEAKAQSTNTVTKSITAADTITWASVSSRVKGFQYTFTESSGTTSGKVYLQGTINGTWVNLDSLTLTDVTTAQTKVFPITSTSYKGYRFTSPAVTGGIVAAYLRRSDE